MAGRPQAQGGGRLGFRKMLVWPKLVRSNGVQEQLGALSGEDLWNMAVILRKLDWGLR